MEVKTGALRDNLSRYLKRVRQTGDTIIVLDRDVPVAEIRPYEGEHTGASSGVWGLRAQFEAQAGALDEDFVLPQRHTQSRKQKNPLD